MGLRWRLWRSIYSVLGIALFLQHSCHSEKAPYPTFAKNATEAPENLYYDYIIIGGGTSGCALAATLSEGANVLLLERGGLPYGNPIVTNMSSFLPNLINILPSAPSQVFVSEGVVNLRARVLGGGSAVNAGFYSRADPDFYDGQSWDMKVVEESYKWVEKKLVFKPQVKQWQSAVRDGLLEAGVTPDNGFTYEHISGTKVGGIIFDEAGHRHTAADLLEYANPNNISVYLYATVHRILFTTTGGPRPKANGVVFKDSKGKKHIAYLNSQDSSMKNEIILTAGALGSPQLLMLSGIGPSKHLKAHKIEVVLDQPMVGQGMADNPMNMIIVPSIRPVEFSLAQVAGITGFGNYVEAESFVVGFPTAMAILQSYISQNGNKSPSPNFSFRTNLTLDPFINAGVILQKVIGPYSTGNLQLKTTNPEDNPKVTFNYFQDYRDLKRCVQGINLLKRVIDSKALSSFRHPHVSVQDLMKQMLILPVNLRIKHADSIFSTEQYCKDTVMTMWHYHGGAQIGHVVDHEYKVNGVDALRVIDTSTLLYSPGTNPQATIMMLGRYMGQKILEERYERWTKKHNGAFRDA